MSYTYDRNEIKERQGFMNKDLPAYLRSTTVKILEYFLNEENRKSNYSKRRHLRGIAKDIGDSSPSNVARELRIMVDKGLLNCVRCENKKMFFINKEYPYIDSFYNLINNTDTTA